MFNTKRARHDGDCSRSRPPALPSESTQRKFPHRFVQALTYPGAGGVERAEYLRRREREALGLPLESEALTPFQTFGARTVAGEMHTVDRPDGAQKLGSAWGANAGSATLNKALARHSKKKIKRSPQTESELRAAMKADVKVMRENSRQGEAALLPDTSPLILKSRAKIDARRRSEPKPTKRQPPRRVKWDRVTLKRKSR